MATTRRARREDTPRLWALNDIPNIGRTADQTQPIHLPIPDGPPSAFPDLADVEANFVQAGGDFIVVGQDDAIVGMGGFRPRPDAGPRCSGCGCTRPGDDLASAGPWCSSWRNAPRTWASSGCT